MSGITLLNTSYTSLFQEQASAVSLRRSTPSGTTTETAISEQISLQTDLRRTVTSLNSQSAAAIVGSVTGAIGMSGSAQSSTLASVFGELGQTMSQGQGAYFVGFSTQSGSVFMSMTPSQYADLTKGNGPEPISGHSLKDALQQAISQAQGSASGGLAGGVGGTGNAALDGALIALSMLQGASATFGRLATPGSFGTLTGPWRTPSRTWARTLTRRSRAAGWSTLSGAPTGRRVPS